MPVQTIQRVKGSCSLLRSNDCCSSVHRAFHQKLVPGSGYSCEATDSVFTPRDVILEGEDSDFGYIPYGSTSRNPSSQCRAA